MGKIKIFNDPVYGLIHIPRDIIYSIIEHPYFQRLRRIKQLGLTDLVYPGAHHTRFHHTIGAVHLMSLALDNLRLKNIEITEEEYEGALLAILLHDIGHGPFSHALEHSFSKNTNHEDVSLAFLEYFNQEFNGQLTIAISIFKGEYQKPFLCELVSGQLDVDRLDYLRRDSFYTGVSEGVIGSDRIIKMINVHNGHLVVDEKGIYSIEKFLVARNLMYWQVYLHKTVLGAELLLVHIIERAKELSSQGVKIETSDALNYFLTNNVDITKHESLEQFAKLDDVDVMAATKNWCNHQDHILSTLSKMLINRNLLKVELHNSEIDDAFINLVKAKATSQFNLSDNTVSYLVYHGSVSNTTYHRTSNSIGILIKDGRLLDFAKASEQYDLNILNRQVQKHYICYPKSLRLY